VDDLIAFLNARLDEDEAFTKAAADPALRWLAAARAILDAYEDARKWHQPYPDDLDDGHREGLATAAKICAAIYSSHPDYQQEWKP
jgi:hypothetical protein